MKDQSGPSMVPGLSKTVAVLGGIGRNGNGTVMVWGQVITLSYTHAKPMV